jgi:hypothetical protein
MWTIFANECFELCLWLSITSILISIALSLMTKDSGKSCRHGWGMWWKVQGITELVYGGIKIPRMIKPKKKFMLSRECGLLEILVGMGMSIYVYRSFKWMLLYELHGLSIEIVWSFNHLSKLAIYGNGNVGVFNKLTNGTKWECL